jgi:hypothetical protein
MQKRTITLFNTAATNGIIHNREDERQNKNNNNNIMLCYAATTYDMNLSERVRNSMNKLWVEGGNQMSRKWK